VLLSRGADGYARSSPAARAACTRHRMHADEGTCTEVQRGGGGALLGGRWSSASSCEPAAAGSSPSSGPRAVVEAGWKGEASAWAGRACSSGAGRCCCGAWPRAAGTAGFGAAFPTLRFWCEDTEVHSSASGGAATAACAGSGAPLALPGWLCTPLDASG
jgi:hypothetical protein